MLKRSSKYLLVLLGLLLLSLGLSLSAQADDAERLRKVQEMYADYKKSFPQVPDLSPEKALSLWKSGEVQFVDVREDKEMAVSMLPGAISWDEYREAPGKYAQKNVVLYCTIGYRSGERAEEALEDKTGKVYNLAGSILGWVHAGGPVYKDGKEVKRIHVYGSRWDLAPEHIEGVYKKGWLW